MKTSGQVALTSATTTLNAALVDTGVDAMRVAEDFFGLSDLTRDDARLRRSLTDPSRSAADKQALAADAFGSKVTPTTLTVVNELVASSWSDPMDLQDACEVLGIVAALTDAQHKGQLELVGHELFQTAEFLGGYRDLRLELSDMGHGNRHERGNLAQSIFQGHVSPWTMRLLRRGVGRTSHGRLLSTLRRFAERAAAMAGSRLVLVETAAPMSDVQTERLRSILSRQLGSEVTLNVTVNPALIGGFRLTTGSNALDSSIHTQVTHLRRAMAG